MTENIIDLGARLASIADHGDESAHDEFLIAEGLDLLGHYRSIEDVDLRHSIRMMVKAIAESNRGRKR